MYSGSVARDAILLKRPLLSWTQQCKRSTWWVNVATVLRHKCIGVQRLFFLTAVQHKKSFQSRFVSDSLHCTCLDCGGGGVEILQDETKWAIPAGGRRGIGAAAPDCHRLSCRQLLRPIGRPLPSSVGIVITRVSGGSGSTSQSRRVFTGKRG